MRPCFKATDILLPAHFVDMAKWAVIACDQHTSQPDYWRSVEDIVSGSPSTLDMIYPEVWLDEGPGRIEKICAAMKKYLEEKILAQGVSDGFVLVERTTPRGTRRGLVGALDLEQYDYAPGAGTPVRATEGTVLSRIPPRVKIRERAPIEAPHVMMLINDAEARLIEPLALRKTELRKLYDFDLMLCGGHVAGYAVEGDAAKELGAKIAAMQEEKSGIFLAAGDGNHSLATAKTCWENIKPGLSDEEKISHPARFSMVELVNLYDDSLIFEPIHRVLYDVNAKDALASFREYLTSRGLSASAGNAVTFVADGWREGMSIDGLNGKLPLDVLQKFLDEYVESAPRASIDYVHGEEDVLSLTKRERSVGILLRPMDKRALFPAIEAGGVLPRKTFSMGEASEKRYYIECRKII